MIPSVIVAVEFHPDLCMSSIINVEIPKKTFEDDIHCIFDIPREDAGAFFTQMYQESKIENKFKRPIYKALRGLVRNVWFNPFEKTFNKLPNNESPVYHFFSDDFFFICSLPAQMLPSTIRELYLELIEKEKPKDFVEEKSNVQQQ